MSTASVWRTARRPRWLALLGVVLVLCVAFGWLGHWQLDVARAKEHPKDRSRAAAVVPLEQVTAPQQVFRTEMQGRPVTVSGAYDPSRQVLVAGKRQNGREGFWVVTALRTSSGATAGALVPVVRGFAAGPASGSADGTSPDERLAPPLGPVTVAGVLQAPEPGGGGGGPAADTADLVNRWGGPIYNVLVFASSGTPAEAERLALTPVPPRRADTGGSLGLRNAAYALQWWLFAAFALLLWWRMVRQDALEQMERAGQAQPADPPATEPKELSPR